jgi:hypothetical protein
MSGRKSADDAAVSDSLITPYYTPKGFQDHTLVFESRF